MKVVLYCSERLEPLLAFDATDTALRNVYYSGAPRVDFPIWREPDDLFMSAAIPADVTVRTAHIELKKLIDVTKFGTREWFLAFLHTHPEKPLSSLELSKLKFDLNAFFR